MTTDDNCRGAGRLAFAIIASLMLGWTLLAAPSLAAAQTGGGNSSGLICSDCEDPEPDPEPEPPPPPPPLAAEFVAQSVPASMYGGQSYNVTLTFKNTGAETWTAANAFRLGSQNPQDNTSWGTGRVIVPASVPTGQSVSFSFAVTAPAATGAHNFQWRMVRDGVAWFGASSVNRVVQVTATNTAPVVSIVSPTSGASALAPATLTVQASASDTGGTIASVSFWSNNVLLGTDASAPYSWPLSALAPGSYTLRAVALDNLGASASSSPVLLSVNGTGQASVTRTYVYDEHQRLCKTINPESGASVVDYDAAGNVAWQADGLAITGRICDRQNVADSQKTHRKYDSLNRLEEVQTPGGAADLVQRYHPDGQARSLTINNPVGGQVTTTYQYNRRRLLTSENSTNGSTLFGLLYGHDANGNLASLTYPDNHVVSITTDALGRATRVSGTGGIIYARDIRYTAAGAIAGFFYGNGIEHLRAENLRQLPSRSLDSYVKGASQVKILDDTYVFDKNGNVTDITDGAQAGLTTRGMGYDGLDRLTAAVSPKQWGDATYRYDAFDNLLHANQGARQYRYHYDPQTNRLLNIKSPAGSMLINLQHDSRGNVLGKNSQAYQFDIANRMSQVVGLETYRYDGQGRRVQTTDANGKTTFWIYSQSGQVLYTSEARRNQNMAYIYLGNTQIATRSIAWGTGATAVRYQHTDSLGSIVAETDSSKLVVKRNSYAPYGESFGSTSIDGTGYTGHVMDRATGLTYMQQRYYDPQLGRFLSIDPMASDTRNGWNFNRYNYAASNPYKFKDPDGRVANFAIKAVVDFGLEVGIQYATTGTVDLGAAAVETGKGMLNPMKTVERAKDLGRLAKAAVRASKSEKHHVVPHRDGRAAAARDHMRANGIEPRTDKSNLVDIPGDKHDVTKRDSYVRDTNDRIVSQPDAASIKTECCKIADNLRNSSTDELKQQYPSK